MYPKLFCSLIALFLITSAKAATQDVQRTLVFLGDSLTAGYQLKASEAFPARIEMLINQAKLPTRWRVVNAGVSGDTTSGGLARLDWVFRNQPDVLFVCLGANDGLRGIPTSVAEANLTQLIQKSLSRGAKVVLGGMYLPSNYGLKRSADFAEMYRRIAINYQLPFLPFLLQDVALAEKYTLNDGVHPNAAGTELIAKNVWKTLEPVLRRFERKQ